MKSGFILLGLLTFFLIGLQSQDSESDLAQTASARLQTIQDQYIAPLEEELSRIEAEKGESHPDLLPILENIGKTYREHGAYLAALPVLKRALRLSEKVHGRDSIETAGALDYLATSYQLQGKYPEARDHYERALEVVEQQLGDDHPAYATLLTNLANALIAMGEMGEAKTLLRKSSEIVSGSFGGASQELTSVLGTLGELYLRTGAVRKAEEILIYALTIRSEALAFEEREDAQFYMAPLQNLLGALYSAVGSYEEAEPQLDDALSAYEAKLDAYHPMLEGVLTNLAVMHEGLGNNAKAEIYRARAETIHGANLGFAFPDASPLPRSVALEATVALRERRKTLWIFFGIGLVFFVLTAIGVLVYLGRRKSRCGRSGSSGYPPEA